MRVEMTQIHFVCAASLQMKLKSSIAHGIAMARDIFLKVFHCFLPLKPVVTVRGYFHHVNITHKQGVD